MVTSYVWSPPQPNGISYPLWTADLIAYLGPRGAVDPTLLRRSRQAYWSALRAMSDLLAGMEYDLGQMLRCAVPGDVIGAGRGNVSRAENATSTSRPGRQVRFAESSQVPRFDQESKSTASSG